MCHNLAVTKLSDMKLLSKGGTYSSVYIESQVAGV